MIRILEAISAVFVVFGILSLIPLFTGDGPRMLTLWGWLAVVFSTFVAAAMVRAQALVLEHVAEIRARLEGRWPPTS